MIVAILTCTFHKLTTPRGPRAITSPEEYAVLQRQWVLSKREQGEAIGPPERMPPVSARISGGAWIVDCRCGNAPMTHPEWKVAYCLRCNGHFLDVIVPPHWREIEAVLLRRYRDTTRNWHEPETVEFLLDENAQHPLDVVREGE